MKDIIVLYKLNIRKQKQDAFSHFKRSERAALYFRTREEAELYEQQHLPDIQGSVEEKLGVKDENNQWLIIKSETRLVKPEGLNELALNEVRAHLNIEGEIIFDSVPTSIFSRYAREEVSHLLLGVKRHLTNKRLDEVPLLQDANAFIHLTVHSNLFRGYADDADPEQHQPYWSHRYDYTMVKLEKHPVTLTVTTMRNDESADPSGQSKTVSRLSFT